MHGANLGTLLRTTDAVGACLAVPRLPWVPEALARGNILRQRTCVHWVGRDVLAWLERERAQDTDVVGVELTDESVRWGDLPVARRRTVLVPRELRTGSPTSVGGAVDQTALLCLLALRSPFPCLWLLCFVLGNPCQR